MKLLHEGGGGSECSLRLSFLYRLVNNQIMARPRRFDRDAAIQAAMRVFWTHGYAQTPLSALTTATGLGKGSLYNAFNSKAELFVLAFEDYQRRHSAPIVEALAHPDLKTAIDAAFAAHIEQITGSDTPPGCMIVGAAIDPPRDAPEIAARVAEAMAGLERAFWNRLNQAYASRALPLDADPRALARAFTALVQGMAVTARTTKDRTALDDIRRIAVAMLP